MIFGLFVETRHDLCTWLMILTARWAVSLLKINGAKNGIAAKSWRRNMAHLTLEIPIHKVATMPVTLLIEIQS